MILTQFSQCQMSTPAELLEELFSLGRGFSGRC